MFKRGFLGVAQVMEDGTGCRDGKRFVAEAATIEGEQAKGFENLAAGVVRTEDPGIERSFETARADGLAFGVQGFADAERFEGGEQFFGAEFGGLEFTRREISVGEAGAAGFGENGGEVVVFVGAEETGDDQGCQP
jgi:hypothetical protein